MKKTLLTILVTIILGCESKSEDKQTYLRWVGDIERDSIDNPDFIVCNGDENVFQYFNLGEGPVYKGEKSSILKLFHTRYKPLINNSQNGFIRLRFVVNCNGEAGRFRVLQSNSKYQEMTFDGNIIEQLLSITKSIKNWEVLYSDDVSVDYYMYLIFKIKDGQLTDILP